MWTVTIGATGGVSSSVINSVTAIAQAAADYWGRYVDTSLASIDIQLNFAPLGGTTLAQATTDYYYAFSQDGFDYFEPETVIEMLTGFDENGSNPDIYVDIDTNSLNAGDFNMSTLVDGVSVGGSGYDLWTVLVHEIGHGLGMITFIDLPGIDRSTFDLWVSSFGGNYSFDGPDPDFGPIALDSDITHLSLSLASVLSPAISPGFAAYLTALDVSVFGDIGAPLLRPTVGNDNLSGFGVRSNSAGVNPAFHGLEGDDTIIGLPTKDDLFGDEGGDLLYGSHGDDRLDGGEGDDTLRADVGADTLTGGNGADIVDYSAATGAAVVNLNTGTGSAGSLGSDFLSGVEGVFGTVFGDTLTGSDVADSLSGSNGADRLNARDGADTLHGDSGDDTMDGGLGDDTLGGESGRDSMLGAEGVDTLHGFGSHDTLNGGDGDDDLRGGYGKDQLAGVADNDVIRGFEGDDRLFGGGGNDTLLGNDDNDSLIGGGGGDRLRGDAGNDSLNGSFGADVLTGGLGNDEFQFRQSHGADTIDDFVAGVGADDVVRLLAFGAAFDTFGEVIAAAFDNGVNTTIDFGAGDMLILEGVLVGELDAGDFAFG